MLESVVSGMKTKIEVVFRPKTLKRKWSWVLGGGLHLYQGEPCRLTIVVIRTVSKSNFRDNRQIISGISNDRQNQTLLLLANRNYATTFKWSHLVLNDPPFRIRPIKEIPAAAEHGSFIPHEEQFSKSWLQFQLTLRFRSCQFFCFLFSSKD